MVSAGLQTGERTIRGHGFKRWRKSVGLSQKEAATALGLKRRGVQYYEKGERDGKSIDIPKYVRLACYAVTLGIEDYHGPEEDAGKKRGKHKGKHKDKSKDKPKAKGKEAKAKGKKSADANKSAKPAKAADEKSQRAKAKKKSKSPAKAKKKPMAGLASQPAASDQAHDQVVSITGEKLDAAA